MSNIGIILARGFIAGSGKYIRDISSIRGSNSI